MTDGKKTDANKSKGKLASRCLCIGAAEPSGWDWPSVFVRGGQKPPGPFAKLRRERPANNSIGDRYREMFVAYDALNRPGAYLCAARAGGSMNLLLGFTA